MVLDPGNYTVVPRTSGLALTRPNNVIFILFD